MTDTQQLVIITTGGGRKFLGHVVHGDEETGFQVRTDAAKLYSTHWQTLCYNKDGSAIYGDSTLTVPRTLAEWKLVAEMDEAES